MPIKYFQQWPHKMKLSFSLCRSVQHQGEEKRRQGISVELVNESTKLNFLDKISDERRSAMYKSNSREIFQMELKGNYN